MKFIRIFFTKTGGAAYISHLDLQRVMARALRRSGLPVWWSQGFNPHIYLSFALPLSLGHQSLCEAVDCKTEADEISDFSPWAPPLAAALPRGIELRRIAQPVHAADEIATAEYRLRYGAGQNLAAAVAGYNAAAVAEVLRKTKRSEQVVDLKAYLPVIAPPKTEGDAIVVALPAGGDMNLNPALLAGYLQAAFGLPAEGAEITRLRVLTAAGEEFC